MHDFTKDFIFDASTVAACGISAVAQVPILLEGGQVFLHGPLMLLLVGETIVLGKCLPASYKKAKHVDELMSKNEYKDVKYLYKEYVRDIALFLRNLGCSPDLKAAMIYKQLLDSGVFSDEYARYALYEEDKDDILTDIWGARVATGGYCCRHVGSLLTDVLKEMGGVAANVMVEIKTGEKQDVLNGYHLVTALVHDGRKVMFDSTCKSVKTPTDGIIYFQDGMSKVKKIVGKHAGDDEKIYIEAKKASVGYRRSSDIGSLMKYPSIDEDIDYMCRLYVDSIVELQAATDYIEEFKEAEKPKVKKLAMLNNRLIPHGEEL